MAEKEYFKSFEPYKPPGVVLATTDYTVKPKIQDRPPNFDFLRLKLYVKGITLISDEGEIKISGTTLDTRRPIQLVEGDNIEFTVNPVTNQISIRAIPADAPNGGLVGTKEVDETLIGHGKVLSYNSVTGKLIYLDLTQAIEDVVNTFINDAVSTAIDSAVADMVANIIPAKVNDRVNQVVPGMIDAALNVQIPPAVDAAIAVQVPTMVHNKVNEIVPPAVENAVNLLTPQIVSNVINIDLPPIVDDKVNEVVNTVVPPIVDAKVSDAATAIVPGLVDDRIGDAITDAINNTVPTEVDRAVASLPHEVPKEVPVGAVDGVNTVFTLSKSVVTGSEHVYVNGILYYAGTDGDYTINGQTITFIVPPEEDSTLFVSYLTTDI